MSWTIEYVGRGIFYSQQCGIGDLSNIEPFWRFRYR